MTPWARAGKKPYVIAEIGVNHDGSAQRALDLVDAAADAGADAVKVQVFEADRLLSAEAGLAAYQRDAGERDPRAMLRRLELSFADLAAVADRARERRLDAIATIFSVELVEAADAIEWSAFKTASPDVVHRPLLEALAGTDRPMIVSTGAASMDEVMRAVEWLAPARQRLGVLQCVSAYPTPIEHTALGGIAALRAALDLPVGYSDHTREVETGALAVAHGATILEKHLTYSRAAAGPDHAASLDPAGFTDYTRRAREAFAVRRGQPICVDTPVKGVLPIEADVRRVARQSIVARRPIAPGATIRRDSVTFKRPGVGLEPWRVDDVIGRRSVRAIPADAPITEGDLR